MASEQAIWGAIGTAVVRNRDCIFAWCFTRCATSPTNTVSTHERKRTASARSHPTAKPRAAMSLMSPPPTPSVTRAVNASGAPPARTPASAAQASSAASAPPPDKTAMTTACTATIAIGQALGIVLVLASTQAATSIAAQTATHSTSATYASINVPFGTVDRVGLAHHSTPTPCALHFC